jgi:hypothetical protein
MLKYGEGRVNLMLFNQSSQYFNEIMPTIYKRFTEKEAKYWRQIYKVPQLENDILSVSKFLQFPLVPCAFRISC